MVAPLMAVLPPALVVTLAALTAALNVVTPVLVSVRAPSAVHHDPSPYNVCKCEFNRILDGVFARLTLPSSESCSVVSNLHFEADHALGRLILGVRRVQGESML